MCFGPSKAEIKLSKDQRLEAENRKREEIVRRAETKRDDIDEALSSRSLITGRQSGAGRRSLLTAPTGAGYITRF